MMSTQKNESTMVQSKMTIRQRRPTQADSKFQHQRKKALVYNMFKNNNYITQNNVSLNSKLN